MIRYWDLCESKVLGIAWSFSLVFVGDQYIENMDDLSSSLKFAARGTWVLLVS